MATCVALTAVGPCSYEILAIISHRLTRLPRDGFALLFRPLFLRFLVSGCNCFHVAFGRHFTALEQDAPLAKLPDLLDVVRDEYEGQAGL